MSNGQRRSNPPAISGRRCRSGPYESVSVSRNATDHASIQRGLVPPEVFAFDGEPLQGRTACVTPPLRASSASIARTPSTPESVTG